MDFTLELHGITDNLLFGQCVSKRENPPHQADFEAKRAGDGTRTRDNLLGRQGLCQLSYSRNSCIRILDAQDAACQSGYTRILRHSTMQMTQRYLKSPNADDAADAHKKFSPLENSGKR
jgi:hypothetical protein